MAKFLYRFHEERGEAHLSVSDVDDVTVWEVNYPDYYEDENGEMAENSTIFDDGYMKNASDISGLENYLKEIGILQPNDTITDDEDDMSIDEENDDADEEPYKYGEDVIEFTIPSWAVSPLINSDSSGLEDEDEEKLDKFTDRIVEKYGNANFMLPNDEDLELGFKYRNDIDSLGSDCVMLLLRPSKQGYATGGTTDSAVFGRFMTSEINHVISLKKVSDKKRAIKAWLENMNDYVGDDMQKRITIDNLKYALTQKKGSEINAVLKTSLNALKDESGSFAYGGDTDCEHVMAAGGTTGKIVVTIADNKIEIKNMIAYNAATLNIMRKVQAEYIGTASAQETKDYIKKELEKRIHFDGSGATADNKDRGLNMLTLDIASKALGHKGYFAEGGMFEHGLRVGDFIRMNVLNNVYVKNKNDKKFYKVDLQKGKRRETDSSGAMKHEYFAEGGYMAAGGYIIVEGKDHYNNKPLYKVVSKSEENDYVGEWHERKENAEIELKEIDGGYMAKGGKADEYETYHDTLSGVLREAERFVEKRGFTFVDEKYFPDISSGGIPYGYTAKLTRGIQKEGRKKEDVLILAIYRMDSGRYELTMYTSYENGGSIGYMAAGGQTFDIKKSVNDFVETLNKKYSDSYLFTVTFANKYAKILHQPIVRGEVVTGKATWGFVALENDTDKGYFEGDLLKAAGASTPAKGARGNILNGTAQYDKYSPQYGKGWRSEGGYALGDIIFQAETKGGKYCIKVFKVADGYEVEEYKNGNCCAFGSYNNIETLTEALNYNIDGSSKIDNINYEVKQNSEGIKMLPVDKTQHPLSRKQIKEKLGHTSGYAAGGTIESKVKNRIKDAFELPLQVAIYVPSTKEKNVIISRREFEKRIDDVEKFLAQLFGGFSAVKVEGGFESSDKGLVQEDAVRVVAFASRENEHGTTFDKSFQELIEHVKNWCTEWSQESIGVEFENDLFYVDANTKYAEGGTTPEKKVKVFEKCRITIKDVDMGGDLVYKGDHWLNKEMIAKMSNHEIGEAIAKKHGLDYGNTFKYTVVKTGETREKFEEGGMPEPFNIDSFLKHVYPDTKRILLRNGLVIAEDYSVTDGGTTDYTHFPLVLHSQGKTSTVTLNYTDNTEDNFGDITYDLNDMTIEVSFPQWDVADSGSYEYELHEDGGQVSRNKEIATIILQQIGGMNRLHMMTGAYNFQALKNGVSFRIKNAKANYIKIMLNGKDLYDVEIGRIRGNTYKVVFSENDVYNEDLKSLIERNTGMYLSLGSGGLNVGRMYKDKNGNIIRYVGNKDKDNGVFIAQDGKYENIPFSDVKFEEGGINEQSGAERVAKELYDPYTSGNPNGGYYAGIRYKGFLHDHKLCDTREEAVKWLDDYDTKSIQSPHNDEAALSKFKNLLSDEEFEKGGTLHEKMNYIFKKYGGHKNEDGTYLEIDKISNDADGRIHVTSSYWNTLSEIKKREFDNDAILQKVKDKYVLISNKPYGYMAKGGKTKDQPVIRQYFEDEAFEYGKGGTVVGDKIYFTESEVKTYLRQKFNIQLEYNLEWFAKEYYSIKYNPSKKTWEEYSQYPMNKENYKGNISEDEVKKKLRHAFKIGLEHNLRSVAQIFEVRYLYSSKKYYHSITKMPDGSIQGFAKGGKVDEVHNAYVIWISDDDEAFFDGGWGSIEDAEDRVSDIEWEEDNKPRYNVFAVEYDEDYFENKNWDITRAKSYRPYGGYGEIKKATGGSVTNKVASEAKKLISGVKKKVRSIAKN